MILIGKKRRGGFTLVELLVVIAIVAVLLAMMLPSLAGARNVARDAICSGNLRQIAIAAVTYAVDRREQTFETQMWNPHGVYFKNAGAGQNPTGCDARPWLLAMSPGMSKKIFYCPRSELSPSTPNYGWDAPTTGDPVFLYIAYSLVGFREPTPHQLSFSWITTMPMVYADLPFPGAGMTGNRPRRLSAMPLPSQIAVATDSQRAYYAGGSSFSYPGYTSTPWVQSATDWVYPHRDANGRWEGTATGFYDGHASNTKRSAMGTISGPPSAGAKYWTAWGQAIAMPMWW